MSNYLVPVYNLENIDKIPVNDLQFKINPNLFLEVLLLRFRRETIKSSAKLKREKSNKEKPLLNEIEILESNNLQLNSNLIELKKQELESLRLEALRGSFVRSRVKWLEEGEVPVNTCVH